MGKKLVLILKTAERCNLNCKYCYFFNGGDQSYKKHPPLISKGVVNQLVKFLSEGIQDLGIEHILVVFHGGEPLLQPIAQFTEMCFLLQSHLSPLTSIDFKVQTNATLISEKWIDAFSQFRVSVGVSLDGPKEYNDIDRIDHRNRGSYDAVRKGIHLLQEGVHQKKIPDILTYLCHQSE